MTRPYQMRRLCQMRRQYQMRRRRERNGRGKLPARRSSHIGVLSMGIGEGKLPQLIHHLSKSKLVSKDRQLPFLKVNKSASILTIRQGPKSQVSPQKTPGKAEGNLYKISFFNRPDPNKAYSGLFCHSRHRYR